MDHGGLWGVVACGLLRRCEGKFFEINFGVGWDDAWSVLRVAPIGWSATTSSIDVLLLLYSLPFVRQFGLPTTKRLLALRMTRRTEGYVLLSILIVARNKAASLKQTPKQPSNDPER